MATHKIPRNLWADLAVARFAPLGEGRPALSYEDAYKRVMHYRNSKPPDTGGRISDKTIKRAIDDAFLLGLVKLMKTEVPARYDRHEVLELSLKNAFKNLKTPIVVDTGNAESDDVHAILGQGLADEIDRQSLLFRSGDVIGIGSGRGPYYTVRALNRLPPLALDEVWLMSLTGSLSPQATNIYLELMFDADMQIAALSEHFGGATIHARRIYQPIAHTEDANIRAIKNTWLDDKEFVNRTPDHAIVGVGALAEKHRFFQEIERDSESEIFKPIKEYIEPLVGYSKRIMNSTNNEYCPIADICNRLFFVTPPPGIFVKGNDLEEREITHLIQKANQCLLTITKKQLEQVNNILLVAGTKIKAPAIYSLLNHPLLKIDMMSIDKITAERVLDFQSRGG